MARSPKVSIFVGLNMISSVNASVTGFGHGINIQGNVDRYPVHYLGMQTPVPFPVAQHASRVLPDMLDKYL